MFHYQYWVGQTGAHSNIQWIFSGKCGWKIVCKDCAMSPHSGPCVRSVSENNIARIGERYSDICCNEVSNNSTNSWDNLTQDNCTLPLRYTKVPPPDTYPPPPGILQRAPSQATMYLTTVPQSLVSRSISTRHHPTRSSLRHSRMLVMITEGRGNTSYQCGDIR